MKHLGLFEGIGGFSIAARWMGLETVAWCEWDKFCQRVLKYHFPKAIPHDDITKTDFTKYAGQIDILTGGFPCQPYSSAGKRLGKEDDRHLWPEMLRAIREVQPRWVVGENVRGLTNWNGGLVFDEVQADLETAGYEVLPFLLPACAVNAPHRRDRIWFIAKNAQQIRRDSSKPESKPSKREQWMFGAGNDVRFSDAANATETERKQSGITWTGRDGFANVCAKSIDTHASEARCERVQQFGAFNEGNGREQPPQPTAQFYQVGDWQQFPTQSPLCSRNDGVPGGLDGITFSKWRENSIGAYGNAIVPQVALQIFKAIQHYNNTI